ncbi:DUF885 domain-containing protein [Paludisphaera rhizosphaerae]|uniref:DUF885 domain-containing protein n=1 Tax=Paludisphaera rhizosphaerae TaxID=2711216 RepID=UPI0013EC89C9|nr:DUF885 domain-containing protein [Paludisphaera rhizosphaerae]
MPTRPAAFASIILNCLLAAALADDVAVEPLGPMLAAPRSELIPVVSRWSNDARGMDGARRVDSWPSARGRELAYAQAWAARLREVDFEALSPEGKIDYLLLANDLRSTAETQPFALQRDASVASFVPFAKSIETLDEARFKLAPVDPEGAAAKLSEIRKQAEELRKSIAERKKEDKLKPELAYRALEQVSANRQALERWFRHYEGFDPLFSWWCREPQRKADEALGELVKALREASGLSAEPKPGDDRQPPLGSPIGSEELAVLLRGEMIAYSPEELIAIAEREFEWCKAERRRAASELGCGDDWKAAMEKIKGDVVRPGEQDRAVRDLVAETLAFLDQHDLVTVPKLARENWTLDPTPPENQKTSPYFFYSPGANTVGMAYAGEKQDLDGKRSAMRSNNVHFTKNAALHELIPGHHLQSFSMARHNAHRRPFGTPFWMEGWSLYWEMLAWDLGFPKTPADRLGFLFWRSHRCARVVFSLKYHLGKMTADQAIDYLVNEVGHERAAAEGEVRRSLAGGYGPLYQAAYMIGGLQFRALHRELVDSGKMTNREFHDRILQGGSMTVEMVRARLTGQSLTRDHKPSWKFAGEAVPIVGASIP